MGADERILRLENVMTSLAEFSADQQRRVAKLEEFFMTLVELARNHDESMDDLGNAQTESEQRIAMLAMRRCAPKTRSGN